MADGGFVWYELATTDAAAAAAFYAAAVGWQVEPVPEMHYVLLKAGEARAAGIATLPEEIRAIGVGPHWTGYIGVADIDAATARAKQAGATLRHGPADIPGIGRFAVLTDPQQVGFNLFSTTDPAPPAPGPMTPGHVGWHELHASDGAAAFEFYAGQFGWTRGEPMPMGPMGIYQLFAQDGLDRGGIMTAPPGERPFWLFYFVVEGIDLAVRRVQEAGGLVAHGPQEVPGGAWIIQCRDPQGAAFALVSGQR